MFLDSDSDFVDVEKTDGSGDEEYEMIEEGDGEGNGLGWVLSLCSLAILLVALMRYLKYKFKL